MSGLTGGYSMRQLQFRVDGFTEDELERLRNSTDGSKGTLLRSALVIGALLIIYIVSDLRPIAYGTITGECSGSILATARAFEGEPLHVAVTIERPYHEVITRVITSNPRCDNCVAAMKAPGEFLFSGHFLGNGPFRVAFSALDQQGRVRCSGRTDELMALGKRP